MSKTLADYHVLTSSTFQLSSPGGHKNFSLDSDKIGSDFVSGGDMMREPILAFNLRALTKNVTMKIEVNSSQVFVFHAENEEKMIVRGYWQVIPGSVFHKNQVNTIHFEVDEGEAKIGDVILWFQRKA